MLRSLLLGCFFGLAIGHAEPAPLRLTILHTNDLHSHNEPYRERGRNLGGMARITHLLQQMRAQGGNTVTLDAGDIFQGSPFFQLYKGEVEVELLNRAGYDIGTIGNHEFDEGPVNLAKHLKNARYKVISCNLDTSKYPELTACYTASAVREFEGQKVGFVGAITPDLEGVANHLEGVKLVKDNGDWLGPIRRAVADLKTQGIDKIVLLTHCGVDSDRELAAGVPDVDLVIGGHSHTRLETPVEVARPDGSRCLIAQADCYARSVGKFDVAFDAQGRVDVAQTRYKLLDVTDAIPEDPSVKAYIEEKAKPLARSREDLHSRAAQHFEDVLDDYRWDSPLGNLITDAFASFGRRHGAPIALHNRGGMRSRIEAGPLTRGQMEAVLPFPNRLLIVEVSGAQLKKVLEHSLAGDRSGRFFDVHGIKLAYKPEQPDGKKLVFVLTQDLHGRWQPLRSDSTYRIAMNDYSFGGGERYDFGKSKVLLDTGERLSEFLVAYAKSHPVLGATKPSRIVPLQLAARRVKDELYVRGLPPGAVVTLWQGAGPGAESVAGGVPVPLQAPRPLQARLLRRSGGEAVWRLPAGVRWVAVVAHAGGDVRIGRP
jgi:5'-nucleotidase / UDP-sugar diphosphatase